MLLQQTDVETFDREIRKSHDQMIERAHDLARLHNIELDYMDKHLTRVDDLLANIAKELRDNGNITPEQIVDHATATDAAECLGFYLIECIERNHTKGTWHNTDPDGEPTICFVLADDQSVIFPMEWIMEKLIDPKGYSVDSAYAQYVG
jgi:hypothetical protein